MRIYTLLLGLLLGTGNTGCGTTCPVGSTLKGGPPPGALAAWCERTNTRATIPTRPAQASNEVLGVYRPQSRGRQLVGPYSDWHRNGHLRSYGTFMTQAGKAVAAGVWTFWFPNGKRAVAGRYVSGYPVGCFAVWTDQGERLTFQARAGKLAKAKCSPPRSAVATRLAEHYRYARLGKIVPERFSAGVGFMLSPNSIPVKAEGLMQPDAAAGMSVRMSLRRKLDWAKVGVVTTLVTTDETRTWSGAAALLGSVSLLPHARRFDLELTTELGVRMYSVLPRVNPGLVAPISERFITPYAGLQFATGYRLTEYLSIYAAVLAQHDLPRTLKRSSRYCDPVGCVGLESNWELGGGLIGAMLQLRVLVR